jgi:hypothetical protein
MPDQEDLDQQILNDIAAEEIARRGTKPSKTSKEPDDRLARLENMVTKLVENKTGKAMPTTDSYERERLALLDDEGKIATFALGLSSPSKIICSYGAAQLVLKPDWNGERFNGVIIVRSLMTRVGTQFLDNSKKLVRTEIKDEVVGEPWCEVWGYLESNNREKIGLLATFPAAAVSCIVSLKSDMHIRPGE